MNLTEKFAYGIVAFTFSTLLGVGFMRHIIPKKLSRNMQSYVESNLEKTLNAQEKELGIQHFGKPNIKVEHSILGIAGLYDRENDTIYLNPDLLVPDNNLTNTLAKIFYFRYLVDAKEVFDHELGHFYTDKLSESLGLGNWPPELHQMDSSHKLRFKLIAEGTAEYFSKKIF